MHRLPPVHARLPAARIQPHPDGRTQRCHRRRAVERPPPALHPRLHAVRCLRAGVPGESQPDADVARGQTPRRGAACRRAGVPIRGHGTGPLRLDDRDAGGAIGALRDLRGGQRGDAARLHPARCPAARRARRDDQPRGGLQQQPVPDRDRGGRGERPDRRRAAAAARDAAAGLLLRRARHPLRPPEPEHHHRSGRHVSAGDRRCRTAAAAGRGTGLSRTARHPPRPTGPGGTDTRDRSLPHPARRGAGLADRAGDRAHLRARRGDRRGGRAGGHLPPRAQRLRQGQPSRAGQCHAGAHLSARRGLLRRRVAHPGGGAVLHPDRQHRLRHRRNRRGRLRATAGAVPCRPRRLRGGGAAAR